MGQEWARQWGLETKVGNLRVRLSSIQWEGRWAPGKGLLELGGRRARWVRPGWAQTVFLGFQETKGPLLKSRHTMNNKHLKRYSTS